MKCLFCGSENPDGAAFCEVCGGKLEQTEENTEVQNENVFEPVKPKKSGMGDLLKQHALKIVAGVVAVALVIGLIALFAGGSGGGYVISENAILSLYDAEEEVYRFVYNNKMLEDEFEGDIYTGIYATKYRLIRSEDKELCLVTSGGVKSIADDVDSYTSSEDDSTVAYTDEDDVLYLYNIKKGKAEEIAEDVSNFSLSPDGQTVAYSAYDGDDIALYVYTKGKVYDIADDVMGGIASNGAKQIYYTKEGNLYVTDLKDNKEKICADVEYMIGFNADYSELMFYADGSTYVTVNGGEKIKIKNVKLENMVTPYFASNVDTLANKYYLSDDDDLYFVNKKWEAEKVSGSVSSVWLSADGKTLYYLKDSGKLYMVKNNKISKATEIAKDVIDFEISPDGAWAYYVDEDDTLYAQKGTKKAKKIADDVDYLYMTHDSQALFLVDVDDDTYCGELYASKNGGEKKKIDSDVYNVYRAPNGTFYQKRDDDVREYYSAKSGTKFKMIYDFEI